MAGLVLDLSDQKLASGMHISVFMCAQRLWVCGCVSVYGGERITLGVVPWVPVSSQGSAFPDRPGTGITSLYHHTQPFSFLWLLEIALRSS